MPTYGVCGVIVYYKHPSSYTVFSIAIFVQVQQYDLISFDPRALPPSPKKIYTLQQEKLR